jgi:hypothetical protein
MGADAMSMDDSFDPATGEIEERRPTAAEHALKVAVETRRELRSEKRGDGLTNIYAKLKAAYEELKPVIGNNRLAKDKAGQRGDYTSYDRIVEVLQPVLLAHGIIFRHSAGHILQMGEAASKTYWLPVSTYLIDVESGQVVECAIPIPIVRPDPHSVGAAVSYGKRYGLLMSVGFATGDASEDDDAQSAMPRNVSDEGEDADIIRDIHATKTEVEANKLKDTYHKRLQALEPEAYENVKRAFQTHVKKLREAPAAEPKAKKPKATAEAAE